MTAKTTNRKYYMNNPCDVVREIKGGFSEIKVYPKFAEDADPSQWCMACMAGGMDGAHPTHQCDEYMEVIDAINEQEPAMLVICEDRLLHSEPVHYGVWKKIKSETEQLRGKKSQLADSLYDSKKELARISEYSVSVREEIQDAETARDLADQRLMETERELDQVRDNLGETSSLVSIGGVTLSMTSADLIELFKAKAKLDLLEAGKVNGWEWYGEAMGDHDIDAIAESEIKGLSIHSIGGK